MMRNESERLAEAAAALTAAGLADCRLAMVLGSGLKQFGDRLTDVERLPFGAVPHWPSPRVEGHGAELLIGTCAGLQVACLTGRVHLYEGWSPVEAVRPVRALRGAGVPAFLLTNAAGGIREGFAAGDLMVITDHLNLTGSSPLTGPHEPALGPRFPDQTQVYDAELALRLRAAGGGMLHEGVYAGLLGPSYETPAEVRMLRALGADAVGMSTVHEATALNAMGGRVAGLSLISNQAAGLSDQPLSHDEVVEAGQLAASRLEDLVTSFCAALAAAGEQA